MGRRYRAGALRGVQRRPTTISRAPASSGNRASQPASRPDGCYGVLRWTAPQAGSCVVKARFSASPKKPRPTVHLLHQGRAILTGPSCRRSRQRSRVRKNHFRSSRRPMIIAVGWGNGGYGGDTTALAATIRLGETFTRSASSPRKPRRKTRGLRVLLAAGQKIEYCHLQALQRRQVAAREWGALSNPAKPLGRHLER